MKVGSFIRWMAVVAVGLCLGIASINSKADTRLAAICSSATTGQGVCNGTVTYDYPSANKLVKVQGTQWYFFSTVGNTALVSVCANDVARGTSICPSTTLVAKSIVPLSPASTSLTPTPVPPAPEPIGTFSFTVSWQPPTTRIVDGKTLPLAASDILGYHLSWAAGTKTGEVKLPATTTSYLLTLPKTSGRVDIRAQDKDDWSDPKSTTVEPKVIKPGVVTEVTVTFGSP